MQNKRMLVACLFCLAGWMWIQQLQPEKVFGATVLRMLKKRKFKDVAPWQSQAPSLLVFIWQTNKLQSAVAGVGFANTHR